VVAPLALAAFAEHQTLSTVQLANLLLIGERASRRLVVAMTDAGFLERVPHVDNRRPYQLGMAAFDLGQQLHHAAVARAIGPPAVSPLRLGECLRAFRVMRGLNQVDAAELFGWERSILGAVERGERPIDLWVIQDIGERIDEDPLVILGARI
jgi:hypothetical protein